MEGELICFLAFIAAWCIQMNEFKTKCLLFSLKARVESPLFDCKQYATGLEGLFLRMWGRHSHGEVADHITDTTADK